MGVEWHCHTYKEGWNTYKRGMEHTMGVEWHCHTYKRGMEHTMGVDWNGYTAWKQLDSHIQE